MHAGRKLVVAASIALLLLAAKAAFAAPASLRGSGEGKSAAQLDEAAKNFHTTSADFEFDTIQTDPIPDKDVQKGTVYYERKGTAFQMAAHIREVNGKIVTKVYSYSDGILKLYEKLTDQVRRFNKAGKFESYLMLGFGASGKDLEEKWNIKYLGSETLDGVKTEKLELVAKDPTVRKNIPKVTIWVDPERGVSLKQVFDEGPGLSRVCTTLTSRPISPCRATPSPSIPTARPSSSTSRAQRRPGQTAWGSTPAYSAPRELAPLPTMRCAAACKPASAARTGAPKDRSSSLGWRSLAAGRVRQSPAAEKSHSALRRPN